MAAAIVGIVVPIDKELHSDDVINFMNVSQTVCILGDKKNLDVILDDISKVEIQILILFLLRKISILS